MTRPGLWTWRWSRGQLKRRDTTLPDKVQIHIQGMTCAACVRRVENALKEVDGVVDVSVNLATSRATVTHLPRWGGVSALAGAVTEQGYEFLGEFTDESADPVEKARAREMKELTVKVICGALLSVIIFFGSMQHWFGFLRGIPHQAMLIPLFVLTAPAVFWVGSRFFVGAFKAAKQMTSDMNTLVAVGAFSAYAYSAAVTFFPRFFESAGVAGHVYYDGAAMIITLILLGRLLEARATGKTSGAITVRFGRNEAPKENLMLYTIAVVLLILWLLGLVTATTMGGFIHILLVIALIAVLLRIISGRRIL
ncbi:MAG: hypothetical protein CVU74_03610 [Deltaproteobacteria bacterium HGW-Deltaproteobacteria-9]|nr:MAG: hypothetical protein CVU74_03610 [Deltaproteobacteria bacterium HGW-Deltaproteobacteria-9]